MDDPMVQGLIAEFSSLEKFTGFVLAAMGELNSSICDDIQANRVFAWNSRLRQPEELYFRSLYFLFIATEAEIPHICSGEPPNTLLHYYPHVNKLILHGQGQLDVEKPGLTYGKFKPSRILNDGSHVSFPSFATCISIVRHPEQIPDLGRYTEHLATYCRYLNYMHEMFRGGKSKEDVLGGVQNLHRPANHWQPKTD